MLDFLFEAKSLRGEWVKGYFWSNGCGNCFIRQIVDNVGHICMHDIEVNPDTVCQCTSDFSLTKRGE